MPCGCLCLRTTFRLFHGWNLTLWFLNKIIQNSTPTQLSQKSFMHCWSPTNIRKGQLLYQPIWSFQTRCKKCNNVASEPYIWSFQCKRKKIGSSNEYWKSNQWCMALPSPTPLQRRVFTLQNKCCFQPYIHLWETCISGIPRENMGMLYTQELFFWGWVDYLKHCKWCLTSYKRKEEY